MDEDFEYFLKKMGPAFDRHYVPQSSMDRYRGKLPDRLLRYWDECGWCGYADGMFWTVNPQDYEPAVEAWIGNTAFIERDAYHVIARGAFGDLYFWGERSGSTLSICPPYSFAVPRNISKVNTKAMLDADIQSFFIAQNPTDDDLEDLFAPALKTLGRLKADEMYGFVPALALGGSADLKHLEKLKAVEHLVFLAQLEELKVIDGPPF